MAIAHVQTVGTGTSAGASSVTHSSLAVGSGSDRTLVATVHWVDLTGAAAVSVSSVVFNTTENFTFRVRARVNWAGNNYLCTEVWTLDNPTNTTANVVATLSEANDSGDGLRLNISEYTGANNGVGANTGSAVGSSADATVTFTTTTSTGLVVGGIVANNTGSPIAPASGETERADSTTGTIAYWVAEEAATAGSQTFSATLSASVRWTIAAVEILAAAGATSIKDIISMGLLFPR